MVIGQVSYYFFCLYDILSLNSKGEVTDMKKMAAWTMALAMAFAVTGCGNSGEAPTTTAAETDSGTIKAVLVTDTGGLGDRSFQDSAWAGMQRAEKELGVEISVIEPKTAADFGPSMVSAVKGGADVVFAFGNSFTDIMNEYAPKFPDTHFVGLNCDAQADNLTVAKTADHEGSFLAGALAAMMTKTGVIGAVGGVEGDNINRFFIGYEEGAHYINPDVKVLKSYIGSFSDPAKGKEFSLQLMNQGADIIFQVAGGSGEGLFEAARENENLYAIGVDANQDYIVEGKILSSMIKNSDVVVFDSIKQVMDGTIQSGNISYNLANNGVGLTDMEFTKEYIGEDHIKELNEIREKIISGEIKVTDIFEQ